jgi:hypothetical protein
MSTAHWIAACALLNSTRDPSPASYAVCDADSSMSCAEMNLLFQLNSRSNDKRKTNKNCQEGVFPNCQTGLIKQRFNKFPSKDVIPAPK